MTFHLKLFALFAMLALIPACGDWTQMDCPEEGTPAAITTNTTTWVRTEDPSVTCAALGAKTLDRGGACISCSIYGSTSFCTLYAEKPSVVSDQTLGHETKHAFGCKHKEYRISSTNPPPKVASIERITWL